MSQESDIAAAVEPMLAEAATQLNGIYADLAEVGVSRPAQVLPLPRHMQFIKETINQDWWAADRAISRLQQMKPADVVPDVRRQLAHLHHSYVEGIRAINALLGRRIDGLPHMTSDGKLLSAIPLQISDLPPSA